MASAFRYFIHPQGARTYRSEEINRTAAVHMFGREPLEDAECKAADSGAHFTNGLNDKYRLEVEAK